MKLIIDISEKDYEEVKEYGIKTFPSVAQSIRNGVSLASVKEEIESESFSDMEGDNYIYVPYLFEILDNLSKESEK